jgi:iron complex outermembrane receptor protein
MLRAIITATSLFLSSGLVFCQQRDSINVKADSSTMLKTVTVTAYEYGRALRDVPAAIGLISNKDIARFNDASILSAVNTVAGVRMEERSPGSYRFSIRGSTLRSPFGVRNIKIYWNNLPFTDAGGNTYLNLIDPGGIGQAEIIKGPGSSLYGASTGGVVLLKGAETKINNYETYLTGFAGSYGMLRSSFGMMNHTQKSNSTIHYAHQQSEGYRDQSAMRRDVIQTQGSYQLDSKRIIGANFFYSDLFYETPGALTLKQFNENRKQARPAAGPNASAVAQKAAIYNKTIYAGVSQEYDLNSKWSNRTGAYISFTQFENPTIRNYERRVEQSFGARSTTQRRGEKLNFTFGGEFQKGFSPIKTYSNKNGKIDTLQTDDEISSTTALIFSQGEIILPQEFLLTVGTSLNFYDIQFKELSKSPIEEDRRNVKPVLSPRIALLKKINSSLSMYVSFSQGFSPPTVAELFPSAAIFNKTLNAEKGNNIEMGFRGALMPSLTVDLVAYNFKLKDAITTRRNDDGGEYFVNVGSTSQNGIEFNLTFNPNLSEGNFISALKFWTTATINQYRFDHYVKDTVNTKSGQSAPADYSGNHVTGVAPNIFIVGADILLRPKFYCNITANYTDKIPLDDGNTAFANRYVLLGGRIGYRPTFERISLDVFVGADNLLDEKYSLGNDLNASAQKFYNAAPGRNFFAGLKISFNKALK